MSVTQVPLRPTPRATRIRLFGGLLLLILAGAMLAWFGVGHLRGETTASGIQFRTVTKGEGPLITLADAALVEYTGTFDDGRVFDSTGARGPAPMAPAQMIPGFAEAMQKMQKGGRYRFRLPPALAYGASPPPGMPKNASLNFDVHIVQVAPGAAAMMAAQQAQGGGQGAPEGEMGPPPGR
jgi:FKBP-type peptidyl-prolyl cis-trans isomerase FkpA